MSRSRGGAAASPDGEEQPPEQPKVQMARRTDFVVQFCWKQTPPTERQLIAAQRREAAEAAAEAAAAGGQTAQVAN